MKREFVAYEIALAMKELGFDEDCFGVIYEDGQVFSGSPSWVNIMLKKDNCIKAPLSQQVVRWFREVHGLKSYIDSSTKNQTNDWIDWTYAISNGVRRTSPNDRRGVHVDLDRRDSGLDSYEEAQDACLRKLIEIVKQK